jgi:hypothetical protein
VRHRPGQIPEYLVQRREQQRREKLKEEQEKATRALVPDGNPSPTSA